MKRLNLIKYISSTLLLVALALGSFQAFGAKIKKVAVLPFTVHAEKDLDFLREGILDMLATRISWKGHVKVIEKELVKKQLKLITPPINKEKALMIGKALGADYVILGSLTVFGQSVSIDAKILDVSKGEILITAFNQSKGMDEVIPTINQFAQDINAKIMGRMPAPPAYYAQPQPGRPLPGKGPLTRVKKKLAGAEKASIVKTFAFEIIGMDTGDVDGDGREEVVLIGRNKVVVLKRKADTLVQFTSIKGKSSADYVYVSVADINGNGKAEVYVSNLSSSGASSLVLERGGGFHPIATGVSMLLRTLEIPGRGEILLGQKRLPEGSYWGPVYLLKIEGGKVVPQNEIKLPQTANVFNFVFAPVPEKPDKSYTILLDVYERLRVYDPDHTLVWRSNDFWGGSLAYIEEKGVEDVESFTKRFFIPSPLYLVDVELDGEREVMVCKNKSVTRRLTETYRGFTSGRVHFLKWDGLTLSEKLTSPKLPGAIVGYRIADLDNDKKRELVVAVVTKEGYLLGKARSQVVVYQLD